MVTNKYQERKEKARQEAIDWQLNFATGDYTYVDLIKAKIYFEQRARRYGLTKEFKENGII